MLHLHEYVVSGADSPIGPSRSPEKRVEPGHLLLPDIGEDVRVVGRHGRGRVPELLSSL